MQRFARRAVTAVAVLVALESIPPPVASADDDPVETAAGLIAEVAPDQGEVLSGVLDVGMVVTVASGTEVEVPLDPALPVTLDSEVNGGPALEVFLPAEVDVAAAQVAGDGTVVYEAAGDGATAVVQSLEDGAVRLQTITSDAGGPHEFTYAFGEGITPVESPGGGVDLLQDYGDVAMVVGTVDDARAADAEGRPVPTTYRIDGDTLVQVILPDDGATYPVVADPKVTWTWWNTTLYFNKKDTRNLSSYGTAAGVLAFLPPPFNVILGGSALALTGTAAIYSNQGKCLKLVWYGMPPVNSGWFPQPYSGAEAGGYCR